MKVKNMISKSGNPVANQFTIEGCVTDIASESLGRVLIEGDMFQSYNSNIAFIDRVTGRTYLDSNYWDYSVTTGKYRNQFLGETKKETQAKIDSGEYILADLN